MSYWTQSSSGDNYPKPNYSKPKYVSSHQPYYTSQPSAPAPVNRYVVKKQSSGGGGILVPLFFLAVAGIGAAITGGDTTSRTDQQYLTTDQPVKETPAKKAKTAQNNNPAPATTGQLTDEMVSTYVAHFAPVAVAEAEKYGIPASISLAQGLIESRAGTSGVAVECNNHFGIKCFSSHHRGCCIKFRDDNNTDSFRRFEGAWGSWREHSKLLSSGRYVKLHQYGRKDYQSWANGLQTVGYATAGHYSKTLITIIEKYELYKYD
jgi:flagellum-specific peptidoglycan hydrolase FlgJ